MASQVTYTYHISLIHTVFLWYRPNAANQLFILETARDFLVRYSPNATNELFILETVGDFLVTSTTLDHVQLV